jgi:hypothetical protein
MEGIQERPRGKDLLSLGEHKMVGERVRRYCLYCNKPFYVADLTIGFCIPDKTNYQN